MSRSVRKSPYIGVTTAESEKEWKRLEARRRRLALKRSDEPVRFPRTGDRNGPKDGKRMITQEETRLLRK